MKSTITIFALIFGSLFGFSQNGQYAKLDSFFKVLEDKDRFFGSVAASKGGEIVYSRGLGYAELTPKTANTTETKFRIGSISKTFTATLIMKGVELGKINLDDKIDRYFPTIQNGDEITVRYLLNHRSGITSFTDRSYFNWFTKPITKDALLDTIINKGLDFEPNADYAYSNSNYVLLTFILEDAFGKPFDKLLDKYIVKPLKLKNTGYGAAINTSKNEARSYRMGTEWEVEPEGHLSIPLGAGGIVSTPTDLCIFARALFNGQIVSAESVEQMKPVGDEEYGFAMYGTDFANTKGLGHGGNIDAFSSNLIYFEEEDICVAVSCNGSNFGTHDVGLAVMSELFGEEYKIPSFEFLQLSSEELQQYVGVYECDDLGMDFTVSTDGDTLFVKIPRQSPSDLEAKGDHEFAITQYGVKIKFDPEERTMHFEQQGMTFLFTEKDPNTVEAATPVIEQKSEDLDKYLGTYSCDELPIDLTISKEENKLIAQGDGQPSFTLLAEGDHVYSNREIGLTITFFPEESKMQFKQGGAAFEMVSK